MIFLKSGDGFCHPKNLCYNYLCTTDCILEKYIPCDYEFDVPQRLLDLTINVDARYVLFVIDKFAGATNLIEELTIVKTPKCCKEGTHTCCEKTAETVTEE